MNLFIKKLVKKEKIKLTEPSDEISKSYLNKSENSLVSSKTLLKIRHYDDATALTYYSMYYSVLALFYKCGIKSENHLGTIVLLKEIFEINNEELKKAKEERVNKQYYVDFNATKNDVKEGILIAEKFNALIKEKLDKLKNVEIVKYRGKFNQEYI